MSELGETISEVIEEAGESRLGTIVALLVALAATFVALAGVKDRNLTLGMTRAQTKAVDAWNQYQAKSMKQNLAEATLDELLAMQEVSGGAAAVQLAKRIDFVSIWSRGLAGVHQLPRDLGSLGCQV